MSVMIILLIASISVAGYFSYCISMGCKIGQFEDDYSPPSRILFDDKPSSSTKTIINQINHQLYASREILL